VKLHTFPSTIERDRCVLLSQLIQTECQLNWAFIRRDLFVSIVPGLLFSTTALINYPVQSAGELMLIFLNGLIYFWLCITTFCMADQIAGIEEDRLNKPERPLVTGMVTIAAAQQRWIIFMVALTGFAVVTHTLLWAMIWQMGCLIYHRGGGAQHWYGKTFLGGLGVTSELGAAWQLAHSEIPTIAWRWIAVIGLYLMTLMAVQDFRDIAGDRAIGRRTMPIVFGEFWSRIIVAAGYFGFPLVVHYGLMQPAGLSAGLGTGLSPTVLGWDIVLAGFSVTIGLRTLLYRNPHADHRTYVGFTLLFCAYLASSMWVLRV
jgi:4-hydroxybenzoate polyprenyltransferase